MKLTCCVFILVCEIVTIVSAQRGGNCQDYGDLPNGKVKVRNKGRVIKFACNKGYVLVGSEIATCIRREWMLSAVTPPLCITNGCKALSVPLNGRLQLDYGGGIARVKCNPGYSFQRDTQVLLFCDGRDWNGTVPTCRATTSLAPTSCDFEEDFCFWQQDAGHNIDWERQRLSTPSGSIGTGPSFDHTRGEGMGGFYIYLEASGTRSVNDSARLYSPYYKAEFSRDSCFIFWYHMYGATMGTLNVYMKPESKEFARSKLLFQQSGNLGNQWIQAILPLDEITENFQIVIEGLRGPSYMSDMAVDDVKLAKGEECLVPSTTQVPETTSKATISPFLSCNGKCGTMPSTSDGNVCSCSPSCLTDFNCCLDYTIYCSETSAGFQSDVIETSALGGSNIIIVTSVLGLTACATIAVLVTLLRRKRMNEERQGSLPEDSDVRYLHNDEEVQLDFTEQEPKNNRKSMVFGFEKF